MACFLFGTELNLSTAVPMALKQSIPPVRRVSVVPPLIPFWAGLDCDHIEIILLYHSVFVWFVSEIAL